MGTRQAPDRVVARHFSQNNGNLMCMACVIGRCRQAIAVDWGTFAVACVEEMERQHFFNIFSTLFDRHGKRPESQRNLPVWYAICWEFNRIWHLVAFMLLEWRFSTSLLGSRLVESVFSYNLQDWWRIVPKFTKICHFRAQIRQLWCYRHVCKLCVIL